MKKHSQRILTAGLLVIGLPFAGHSQSTEIKPRKGRMFVSWGWNRAAYSKSDIHFTGAEYDFTLYDVTASDRPTPFSFGKYLNLKNVSVPQYNFRIGYYLSEKYSISIAWDHLKYVADQNQMVVISGDISAGTSYDGTYVRETIPFEESFMTYEHTNGLNSANVELRRYESLYTSRILRLEFVEGLGFGLLFPRTDANLFRRANYDAFHLSGYEFHGLIAFRVGIGRTFFLMTEFKTTYNEMHDIRTTLADTDRAEQNFFSYQGTFIIGANFGKSGKQE